VSIVKSAVRRAVNTMGFDIRRISTASLPIRIDVPAPLQEHVDGAALYADRISALEALPRGGVVAEIGVALGDFSQAILDRLAPRLFDAFDLFKLHEVKSFWGRLPADYFGGLSHRAHYERRFADEIAAGKLRIHEGDSSFEMGKQPVSTYDVIYVDGDHTYDGVMRDAAVSARKLKSNGVLIFNDYIMFDHVLGVPYGIVPVVNDFCVNHGWQVLFFALQDQLFCDIALRRRTHAVA
jgi:hypothetical protein